MNLHTQDGYQAPKRGRNIKKKGQLSKEEKDRATRFTFVENGSEYANRSFGLDAGDVQAIPAGPITDTGTTVIPHTDIFKKQSQLQGLKNDVYLQGPYEPGSCLEWIKPMDGTLFAPRRPQSRHQQAYRNPNADDNPRRPVTSSRYRRLDRFPPPIPPYAALPRLHPRQVEDSWKVVPMNFGSKKMWEFMKNRRAENRLDSIVVSIIRNPGVGKGLPMIIAFLKTRGLVGSNDLGVIWDDPEMKISDCNQTITDGGTSRSRLLAKTTNQVRGCLSHQAPGIGEDHVLDRNKTKGVAPRPYTLTTPQNPQSAQYTSVYQKPPKRIARPASTLRMRQASTPAAAAATAAAADQDQSQKFPTVERAAYDPEGMVWQLSDCYLVPEPDILPNDELDWSGCSPFQTASRDQIGNWRTVDIWMTLKNNHLGLKLLNATWRYLSKKLRFKFGVPLEDVGVSVDANITAARDALIKSCTEQRNEISDLCEKFRTAFIKAFMDGFQDELSRAAFVKLMDICNKIIEDLCCGYVTTQIEAKPLTMDDANKTDAEKEDAVRNGDGRKESQVWWFSDHTAKVYTNQHEEKSVGCAYGYYTTNILPASMALQWLDAFGAQDFHRVKGIDREGDRNKTVDIQPGDPPGRCDENIAAFCAIKKRLVMSFDPNCPNSVWLVVFWHLIIYICLYCVIFIVQLGLNHPIPFQA